MGALRKESLRTIDTVAMAIAVLSPAMAMAYNTSESAAFSGTSTPLAFLIGGIACLALAFVVIGFTGRMASAGHAYAYSSLTLGKRVGFLTGWMYFFGFFCFVPMTMSGVGGVTATLIQTEVWHGMPSWFWFPLFLVGMALMLTLSFRGIRISMRALLWVGTVTAAVIVATATVSAFVSGILWNLGPYTSYFFYASIGTIAVCLVYVVLCVGGSVDFRRISARYNLVVHGLIPAIGIAVFGLAVYGSVYRGAIPPAPYTFVHYVNLGWLLLGIAFVVYLSENAPEKVGQIGSILGEEGGAAAGILDQPTPAPAVL